MNAIVSRASAGSFAFVTNIRNKSLATEGKPTRGELPFLALESLQEFGADAEAEFLDEAGKYNPFNLVWGDRHKIHYFNNIEGERSILDGDLLAISNSTLPCVWPKAVEGKNLFEKVSLDWDDERIFSEAFLILREDRFYDFVPEGTGFSEDVERQLSPIFIDLPNYGTVSSTVMLAGEDGVRIEELRWPSRAQTRFVVRPSSHSPIHF